MPAGKQKIKFVFVTGGINLNYFNFVNPQPTENIPFTKITAQTSEDGQSIFLYLNKAVTTNQDQIDIGDFTAHVSSEVINVFGVTLMDDNKTLLLQLSSPVYYGNAVTLSYSGSSVLNDQENLEQFSGFSVTNMLPVRYTLPAKIQAEGCSENNGFEWENCEDTGGGLNSSYANAGDYLDYRVYVTNTGTYSMNYRLATERTNAEFIVLSDQSGSFIPLDTIKVTSTGGWQEWKTQQSAVQLPEGRYTLRIRVKQSEFNLNWFQVQKASGIEKKNM
ncbi:MAG: carbohydrate-binding protein [Bacteroidales bacterium]|nr:carbohydrate-binding protein [Bacteroidales bacterium]